MIKNIKISVSKSECNERNERKCCKPKTRETSYAESMRQIFGVDVSPDNISNSELAFQATKLLNLVLHGIIIPIKNERGNIIAMHSPDAAGITGSEASRWSNGTLHVGRTEREVARSEERFAAFKESCPEMINNPMLALEVVKAADGIINSFGDYGASEWCVTIVDGNIFIVRDEDEIYTSHGDYICSESEMDISEAFESFCKAYLYDKSKKVPDNNIDDDDDDNDNDGGNECDDAEAEAEAYCALL